MTTFEQDVDTMYDAACKLARGSRTLVTEAEELLLRSKDAANGIFPRAEDPPQGNVYKSDEVNPKYATRR